MMRHRVCALLMGSLVVGLVATGCGAFVGTRGDSGCMPPPFSLSTDTARPGEAITVSADDATCNPRYGDDARIQLEIMDASGSKVVDTTAPMNDAGGFSTVVVLPETAVPGQGSVSAYPYNLDWCDDTGKNNRVHGAARVGHGGSSEILRVSCVMPTRPLTVAPDSEG